MTAQGKSQREIHRYLKRTLARQPYRLLERTVTNPASSDGTRPRELALTPGTAKHRDTGRRPAGRAWLDGPSVV
jgi:hypothetical protein